jgi:hypothetical protein
MESDVPSQETINVPFPRSGEVPKGLEEADRVVEEIRGKLREGGPPVDFLLVAAHAEGLLQGQAQERVRSLVKSYRDWANAYWEFLGSPGADATRPGAHNKQA